MSNGNSGMRTPVLVVVVFAIFGAMWMLGKAVASEGEMTRAAVASQTAQLDVLSAQLQAMGNSANRAAAPSADPAPAAEEAADAEATADGEAKPEPKAAAPKAKKSATADEADEADEADVPGGAPDK